MFILCTNVADELEMVDMLFFLMLVQESFGRKLPVAIVAAKQAKTLKIENKVGI